MRTKTNSCQEVPLLPEENCDEIRKFLRQNGREAFLRKYVIEIEDDPIPSDEPTKKLSLREVLYALGLRVTGLLDALDEESLIPLLNVAINRELTRRQPLADVSTIDDVVRLLKDAKNVVILTGAGISTSLGIPDFRSDQGIYRKLELMGLSEPQEVFDLQIFREDPRCGFSRYRRIQVILTAGSIVFFTHSQRISYRLFQDSVLRTRLSN